MRPRCGSPVIGSTLMTSAPQSTSTEPPDGMNIQLATSMTRMPSSGPARHAGQPTVFVSVKISRPSMPHWRPMPDCL